MNQQYRWIWILLPLMVVAACKDKKQHMHTTETTAAVAKRYTCPMHPQVVQEQPGTCPVCGMDLVLFDKNSNAAFLLLSEEQQVLANVSSQVLGDTSFSAGRTLHGKLVVDPSASVAVSARIAGRIEVLFVKETGARVQQGQPLYKIYAEQLLSLQQEYLMANAQAGQFRDDARFQQIARAAKQKLVLYGQSESQLQQLLQQQKTNPYVVYYAPVSGVVASLDITEGQYVAEGGSIMRLEDYSRLWVEADLYPGEAAGIRQGQELTMMVAGWEQEPQRTKVQFINPAVQAGSQLVQLRGAILNKSGSWQPGLEAMLVLPGAAMGKQLTLPVDAVIRDGKGKHVWVETDKGKYEPRQVTTGEETDERVAITEGVQAGDKVVVTGAYLLYSEYVLKKGKNPIEVHAH